jgi:hypothetical protein
MASELLKQSLTQLTIARLPQIHVLKSELPVPQNVTIFGDTAFKELMNIK